MDLIYVIYYFIQIIVENCKYLRLFFIESQKYKITKFQYRFN